jgi:hypothetical protein
MGKKTSTIAIVSRGRFFFIAIAVRRNKVSRLALLMDIPCDGGNLGV